MLQKQKLSIEEKVKIVRECLQGNIGIREAARSVGITTSTIRQWMHNYEADGVGAFLPHKNRIYSPDLKRQAAEDYLFGGESLRKIAKKYGLRSKRQLSNWIRVYTAHGDFNSIKFSGGSYMKQGRETTLEERIQIVRECIACGKNYGEMALKYQVSYQQVRTWTLRFEQMGEAGLEDRRGRRKKDQVPRTELEQAQIEIEQLKHKMELLTRCLIIYYERKKGNKKDAYRRHPIHLIILFKFKAVAERRQWSSAASKPRRKTRVKLCPHFWAANVPSHQNCRLRSASRSSGSFCRARCRRTVGRK